MGGKACQLGNHQAFATHMGRTFHAAFVPFVVLGILLAGCSDEPEVRVEAPTRDESPSTIPTTIGSAPTSTSSPPDDVAATKAEIQERYERYHEVVAEVGAASDPDDPRLADYATGGVLANLRGTFALRRAEGRRLYGQAVPHVSAVSVTDNRATVQDCLDNSATGLMDAAGTKLNVGRAKQLITVSLV